MTDTATRRDPEPTPAAGGPATASATAPAGGDAGSSGPGGASAPRRGRSLAVRIALLAGGLVVLAVAAAVLVTSFVAREIASDAADEDLETSYQVQLMFEEERYGRLFLLATQFVQDPDLAAYLAEAAERSDTASILDILGSNQSNLGFDFAILVDPDGRVLAHTARPDAVGEDLGSRPLVATALVEYEAAGVWSERGRLYDAVVVPVIRGFEAFGFLVAGYGIDDVLAADVAELSQAQVAYLSAGDDSAAGPTVAASTLDERRAEALVGEVRERWDEMLRSMGEAAAEERDHLTMDLAGEPWLGRLAPLEDASGEIVGATVALVSLDEELSTYRRIQWVLVAVGLVALLAALALSWPLARRTLRPVRELAAAADAARRGNYDQDIPQGGADEVGRLASAFDALLADLRERRDMETYMEQLAKTLPDAAAGVAPVGAPEVASVTLLAFELRRYVGAAARPSEAMERLALDVRRIGHCALARDGRVESVLGHRVLVSFEGDGGGRRALQTACEALSAMAGEGGEEALAPAAAIAQGDAVRGGVSLGGEARPALVGRPVQQAETLLREAAPGEVLLEDAVATDLAEPLKRLGLELSPHRSLVSSRQVWTAGDPVREFFGRAAPTPDDDEGETVRLGAGERESVAPRGAETLSELAPGSVLGQRFEIVSVLGAGGMGVVYKARDRELDDLVALKVLKREAWGDGTLLARLKDELKLARRITHPNVLRTHDFGEFDGIPFVSMEYVKGVTLRYLLDRQDSMPTSGGLWIARQLAAGLAAAHERGVVHRDIKPENVLLDSAGKVKLMDFGIARLQDRLEPGHTRAGFVVGTPRYLAPEQLRGEEVTTAADVYAAGVLLYEIFVGRPPFTGETVAQTINQHLNEAPRPPRQVLDSIPEGLESIILRCLEKDAGRRYPDAGELFAALEAVHS